MMTMITTRCERFSDKMESICRLCLKEEGPMSPIFTATSSSGSQDRQEALAARITSIAQVQVDKFYDFRLLVEVSDRKLRSCFETGEPDAVAELRRISVRNVHDEKGAEYEAFCVEGSLEEKELLPVNAILVPSSSGMQVWQLCSVDDEEITDECRTTYTTLEENPHLGQRIELAEEIDDSDLDDLVSVERCMAQGITPITIKTVHQQGNQLYFGTPDRTLEEEPCSPDKAVCLKVEADDDFEEEHLLSEEYHCQLCFKSFHTLEALKSHVSDHSLIDRKPSARELGSDCDAPESEEETLENIVQEEDPSSVNDTGYVDSHVTTEERIFHTRKPLNVRGLKCRYCDKSFLKLSSRNYHEESVHDSRSEKTHKCDECGKEFLKRSELRYHKGTHSNAPSTCTICNKHFRNVQSFKMHLKRHTLGSRYNCPDCGKSYYTNSELARHVQQHTGLREYPCNLCDMSFLSKPELNRHIKYHKGVKTFQCKVCLKTYYESGHLKVHERVHTGERPFACTICQKSFITKSKLVRHLKTHDKSRTGDADSVNVSEQYRFTK